MLRSLSCSLLFLAVSAAAGTFSLEKSGDRYTLTATDTVLSDILAEIDRQEPASLRFYGDYPQSITATYREVPLEQLLDRLGVSYVLTYEADAEGNYRLGDAMTLDSDAAPVPSGNREAIRNHIQNLRDDDIKWNAHEAANRLMDLDCEAVPYLEEALRDPDPQARHIAANLLRQICPEHVPSQTLLDVTLALLNSPNDEYAGELVYPILAYAYLNQSNIYPHARSRLVAQLSHVDPRVRLYSSLIVANQKETAFASSLVRTLLPHLSDNDLKGDAAAAAYALRQLGNAALPYLVSARSGSTDPQQKELLGLVISSINGDDDSAFHPTMYVGYNKRPTEELQWVDPTRWDPADFPDAQGRYPHGGKDRMTAGDYYRY